MSEETGWSYSFGDLDAYKDGIAQEYTVSEDKVEYYTTTISGDAESGFIVKNTEIMGQGGTPENPDDEPGSNHNPKTGDAIIESIIMLMISISGFASGLFYLRKLKFAKNN